MARILVTNGGKHSADKWAMTTAEMIFPLDNPDLVGERLIAAQKFQTQIAEILSPHHALAMEHEGTRLQADPEHFQQPLDANAYLDNIIGDIQNAAKGTPWAAHFLSTEVISIVREIVENHIHTVQHTERLWHAAHNPSEHGDSYRAIHQQ